MQDLITPEELAAIELRDARPGEVQHVALAGDEIAEARGAAAGVALSAALSIPFLTVRAPAAESHGVYLELSERRDAWRVSSVEGTPLVVTPLHGPAARAAAADDDPAVVYLRPDAGARVVVTSENGRIVLRFDASGLSLQPIGEGTEPAQWREQRPPIADWTRAVRVPWLRAELESRSGARFRDALSLAGLYTRFQAPDPGAWKSAPDARARARLVPGGEARDWARRLREPAATAAESVALDAARALRAALDRFHETTRGEAGWRERWRRLCLQRDDLEGMRVLLREAGRDAALDETLREVDAFARSVSASNPPLRAPVDERLSTAATASPFAWWTRDFSGAGEDEP